MSHEPMALAHYQRGCGQSIFQTFNKDDVGGDDDDGVLCCVCPQRTSCCSCVHPSSGRCLSVSAPRTGWFWQERTQTTLNQWKVDCLTLRPASSTAGSEMPPSLSVCPSSAVQHTHHLQRYSYRQSFKTMCLDI